MARTVGDAALMLSVLAGPDDADPYSLPGPTPAYDEGADVNPDDLRIAYTPDFGVCRVMDEVRRIVEDALEAFADAGAAVEEVDAVFDQSWETLHDALNVLLQTRYVGMDDGFRETLGVDLFELDNPVTPEVLSHIERGRELSVRDYQRA